MAIVCQLCGVRQDAVAEPHACSGQNVPGGHEWGEEKASYPVQPSPGSTLQQLVVRETVLGSAAVFALIAAIVLVVKYWQEIVAVIFGLLEWVFSWPAWLWICLCILSAANRIVRAIDRQTEKPKQEKAAQ
jgi:uncharacterized integral membrane protein